MTDKFILVTAASRGLGYSVAKALINEGARVLICSREEAALTRAVATLGERAEYVVADLTKTEDINTLFERVRTIDKKLDGLFVNAGGPPPGHFDDFSDAEWQSAFELTFMSAVRLTRVALPLLRNSESPTLLSNTSISVKQPVENLILSNAIRAAVIGMMRTLADEVGPLGIRINAVCPGYTRTARLEEVLERAKDRSEEERLTASIPLRRLGYTDEFGAVCAFLLSPVASYIHGALLLVDGGLYRGMA